MASLEVYRVTRIFAAVLVAVWIGAPVPATDFDATVQSATTEEPPKLALLVGVKNYKPQPSGLKVPDLRGTHNDVALMRQFLGELGFSEEKVADSSSAPCGAVSQKSNIQVLCSEQATKDGILTAFERHLIGRSMSYWNGAEPIPSKGPLVVFYFSGHGSQLDDRRPIEGEKAESLDIDETDGRDETVVPYDSDTNGSRDIRDDSFKKLLSELRRYTTNVVFIADSCHSGTVSRGPGAKNIARALLGARPNHALRGKDTDMPSDSSTITISGALSTQLSYEDHVVDPVTKADSIDGLLTYYLVQNARQYPMASYRELIQLVQNGISSTGRSQTPQVEGDIDRIAFGSEASSRLRSIGLTCKGTKCSSPSDGGLKVELAAGEVVGAKSGVPIAIYSPEARELTGARFLVASGVIESSTAFSSIGRVSLVDKGLADLPPLAKVVLIAPGFSDRKRRVALAMGGTGPAPMKKLASQLAKNPFYEITEVTDPGHDIQTGTLNVELVINRGTFRAFREVRPDTAVRGIPDEDDGYFITDAKGVPIYDLWIPNIDTASAAIQTILEKHAKIENLRALQNRASTLNSLIKIDQIRYKSISWLQDGKCMPVEFSSDESSSFAKGTPRLRKSEAFDVRVTNSSSKPLYLYLVSINAAGAIAVIFPDPVGANEIIKPGSEYLTSGGDCASLLGFPDEEGAPAPTGFETVKVIVSERPIAAELLQQSAIVKQTRGPSNPLEKLLMDSTENVRTRGFGNGSLSFEWAAFNINYVVLQ